VRLKRLGDSQGEIGQIALLCLWRDPFGSMSTEETLHLDPTNTARTTLAENDTIKIKDLLSVLVNGKLAIGLTGVVKTDTLGDGGSFSGDELEKTTSDGIAKIVIA